MSYLFLHQLTCLQNILIFGTKDRHTGMSQPLANCSTTTFIFQQAPVVSIREN